LLYQIAVRGDEVVGGLHANFGCDRIVIRVQEGNGIGGPNGLTRRSRAEIRRRQFGGPSAPEY